MTPLERAARAICEANDLEPDTPVMAPGFQREVSASVRSPGSGPYLWERFVPQARAVLKAIRKPSDAMRDPFTETLHWDDLDQDDVWQTMIDAALEEG